MSTLQAVDVNVNHAQTKLFRIGAIEIALTPKFKDLHSWSLSNGPQTVIPISENAIVSEEYVREFCSSCFDTDDALRYAFFESITFCYRGAAELSMDYRALSYLRTLGTKTIDSVAGITLPLEDTPSGPFVAIGQTLWEPWRFYHDYNNTFMVSFQPSCGKSDREYKPLECKDSSIEQGLKVPVPLCRSQLPAQQKPLHGWRIAVKDCYDVRGIRTSLSNKAYYELFPPASRSAAVVKALCDAGGNVVGKTRLCSLVSKEDPTEAVDYAAPFNPRADGYQAPSGSSTGSAAAISSYPWLDLTIGTDTNGSMRRPANVHGCFGLRPTHGVISSDGLFPSFPLWDTPALFTRDIKKLAQAFSVLSSTSESRLPSSTSVGASPHVHSILYPKDFLPTGNEAQMAAIDLFVSDLESSLGLKREEISISDSWLDSGAVRSESLHSYLKDAGWKPVYYDSYHNLVDFFQKYEAEIHKKPYVTPWNRWRFSLGKTITKEDRQIEIEKLNLYKEWLLEEIFRVSKRNAIMIIPIDQGQPIYRDAQPGLPVLRNGDLPLNLSPILGAPEITVPIAEIPYDSDISGRTEQLPISVSVLGPPDFDTALIEVVRQALLHGNRPTEVFTGKSAFHHH